MFRVRFRCGALALGMIALFAPSSSYALPTELVPRWSAFYGYSPTLRTPPSVGVGSDSLARALAIAVSPDGTRTYVTGLAHSANASIAYDTANGAELWTASFPGSGGWPAADIAVNPDGTRVYVTARAIAATTTVAYDATEGTQLWTARYDDALGYGSEWGPAPQRLAVSPDGTRAYIAAGSGTVAYDATDGSQLWVAPEGSGSDLAVSPDSSRVYVSGESSTVALDAGDGSQIWVAPGTGSGGDFAMSIDGASLYVVGWKTRLTTSSYDAVDGSLRWSFAAYDHSYSGYYFQDAELAVGPDRRVFVTATLPGVTLAFDDRGLLQWIAQNSLPGFSRTLSVSPDGLVYVSASGSSEIGLFYPLPYYHHSRSALVVYDYLGNEVSTTSFEAEWSDVAVSSDGSRLFATGSIAQWAPGIQAHSWATVAFCKDVRRALYELSDADIPSRPACLTGL